MFSAIFPILAGVSILCGSIFSLLAAIGIVRLPDLFTRMHAASKAGTMGAGLMFLAVALISFNGPVILRAFVGFVFLLLTAPVSAHLLARAAYFAKQPMTPLTRIDDLKNAPPPNN
ncbi:MAG: monovalent cation/H(+) antiporter subunit G [Hyphomicrobiaceae bacterium]|nr:monovalent cation/H(+) antiporter subunit G [Hyphomicrobiaceae bacterium]